MNFSREQQKRRLRQLRARGNELCSDGKYREAQALFREMGEISRLLGDRELEVEALRLLGYTFYVLGDYQQTLPYAEQTLLLAKQINDLEGEKMALDMLAGCYTYLGKYDQALEYLQKALALAQSSKNLTGEALSLGNIGSFYQSLGDFPAALQYLNQALAVAQTLPDKLEEARAWNNLGRFYALSGDYPQSLKYLQQSLSLMRQHNGAIQDIGNALEDLGNCYQLLGDYEKATANLMQALRVARDIGNLSGEVMALGALGPIARYQGKYLEALQYLQQGLALTEKMQAPTLEIMMLGNLGNVHQALGDFTTAEYYQQRQLLLAREMQNKPIEATCLNNLGGTSWILGKKEQANEYLLQSLQIVREINHPSGEIFALHNLARLAEGRSEYKQAEEYYRQALFMAEKIDEKGVIGRILSNLGRFYDKLGNYEQAMIYHQRSLEFAQLVGSVIEKAGALSALGRTLLNTDRLEEAERAVSEAVQIWETVRAGLKEEDAYKISFFDQLMADYSLFQTVLVKQGKIEQALVVSERGRARTFAELMNRSLSPIPEETARFQLAPITIEQIQHYAQEQQVTLVEYSLISGGEIYIWVVNPSGIVQWRSVGAGPLFQRAEEESRFLAHEVNRIYEHRGLRSRDIFVAPAQKDGEEETTVQEMRQFYQLLIAPIKDLLPESPDEQIILVPQSHLFLLPFAAFQDDDGHILLEQYTLRLAPSLQVLNQIRQKRRQQTDAFDTEALIVGNPVMPEVDKPGQPPEKLRQLPQAEQEARAIAGLLQAQPLIGSQATKTAVLERMPTASLLHLATHAGFEDLPGLGVPGAIALAPSETGNGWLTSEDILALNLRASLAVLSACSTGQGRITGDGIIGLARSFIGAGVPSLIVSLWAVQDAPTAFLMTEFYRLLQQHQDKAMALRNAMLAARRLYPDLSDWAAFVLIGDAL